MDEATKAKLRDIARNIDHRVEVARPYSLNLYQAGVRVPITVEQKQCLEKFLEGNFNIWSKSWLWPETDEIRRLIGDEPIHED